MARSVKSRKAEKPKPGKTWKVAMKGFFGVTSRVLMLIVAGLLVVSYVSMFINPSKTWWFTLFGLMFIPFTAFNFILLLWAIKRRSKTFVIPLLAIATSLLFIGRYIQFGDDDQVVSDDPTLKILSYNVGRFSTCDKDSLFAFIRSQDPDIVCLQEYYVSDIDKVRGQLRDQMKGYRSEFYLFPMADGSAFGNVTLSRIPVKGKGKIKFEESANLAIYTDYEYHDRAFRVYNCHFESYSISLPGLLRGLFKADKAAMVETGDRVKKSISRRPKQVDMVFEDIERCPVEAFVCGDFNDDPMSYTYFRMTRGRKDSFREAGKGFGATFTRLWPMLRIDYIMLPDRFDALEHTTPRVKYSDHYPVISTIEL